MSNIIYPADLAPAPTIINKSESNGVYWMPPPPPSPYKKPDYPPPPPPPPYPYYPYPPAPSYPPMPPYPPPPPPHRKDDSSDKPDSGNTISKLEKELRACTKNLAVLKCMIKNLENGKNVIVRTEGYSYNLGTNKTTVEGWEEGENYVSKILILLNKEKELVAEKIQELAQKLGSDETAGCGCGCNSTICGYGDTGNSNP